MHASNITFTVKWTNSLLLCPDSRVGYRQWGKEQTYVWSLYLVLILRHLEPPSPYLPHWTHKHNSHRVRDKCVNVTSYECTDKCLYRKEPLQTHSPTWSNVSGCYFSPWHPRSPFLCTFSDAHHLKKNILLELQWLPQARTPSSLGGRNMRGQKKKKLYSEITRTTGHSPGSRLTWKFPLKDPNVKHEKSKTWGNRIFFYL